MWLLGLNGVAYLVYGFATGRFRRMLLPIRPHEVVSQVLDALRLRLKHADVSMYNAVQRVLYVGVILALAIQITTGLLLWKPVQFSWLLPVFYDFQGIRLAHFLGMAAIASFLVVHIALALLVPRTLAAMVTGGPRITPTGPAATEAAT